MHCRAAQFQKLSDAQIFAETDATNIDTIVYTDRHFG